MRTKGYQKLDFNLLVRTDGGNLIELSQPKGTANEWALRKLRELFVELVSKGSAK